MNHPLARIFVPITMIVVIAASSVAVGTAGNFERIGVSEAAVAKAMIEADATQAAVVIQTGFDQP
jgi:hypothetical protein